MAKTIRADLHMHPGFYDLRSGKKVPSLTEIVNHLFKTGLVISSISACHPKKGIIDYRYHDYMKQLKELEKEFVTDYNEEKGILHVARKRVREGEPHYILILNSQEVRADYKGIPADMNIIGVKRIIEPEQDIDETARMGREEGGITLVCHPASRCGAGIEKALEMFYEKKVNGIEGFDATVSPKENEKMREELEKRKIKGLAVSDAHHYSMAGSSYSFLEEAILYNFSIDKLGASIESQNFDTHPQQSNPLSVFRYHTFPVLTSIPGHLIRNPRFILSVLSKRKTS